MLKKKLIISILLIIGGMTPFVSFGVDETEPCLTCGSSPAQLSLLNSFTTEMLSSIRTIGTEGSYAGKYVPPSRFDSGKFIAPKQTILSKSIRRAREEVGSILGILRINLEFSDLANIGDSLSILAQNKAILRDRQKLEKLNQSINKKKYELSVGNGWTDKIRGDTKTQMDNIIKRYKELGVLENSTKIEAGSEYGDLIMLLGRMNSSLKLLVSTSLKGRAAGEKKRVFSLRVKGKIAIKVKDVDKIKDAYACTRRYACEESRSNYTEALKEMLDAFKNGNKNAWEEVKRANNDLLNEYIATQEATRKKREKIKESTKKAWNQLSGSMHSIKDRRDQKEEEIKDRKDQRELDKEQAKSTIYSNTVEQKDVIDSFMTIINDTEIKIQNEASTIKSQYLIIDKPDDILIYFVLLSEKINGISNNIIGSKDSDKDCLIKNLGALCEKQCSNIANKACYY